MKEKRKKPFATTSETPLLVRNPTVGSFKEKQKPLTLNEKDQVSTKRREGNCHNGRAPRRSGERASNEIYDVGRILKSQDVHLEEIRRSDETWTSRTTSTHGPAQVGLSQSVTLYERSYKLRLFSLFIYQQAESRMVTREKIKSAIYDAFDS